MDVAGLFRGSGQRDDRRRLLLCEAPHSPEAPPRRRRRKQPQRFSPHYGDPAFLDQLPRLTDLIPRAWWIYVFLGVVGLGIIGALEWLYGVADRCLAPWTTDGSVEAFDLDGEGSLAVWFSSTTLLLAAASSLVVYLVRRHRRDDYQGRYRIWLWAAGCWLLMSLDETASLHEAFKEMMVLATGQRLGGDGSLWWVMTYFFLLGGVGIRLLVDMRECLLASSVFVGAGLCYAGAVAGQLQWLFAHSGRQAVMIEEGLEMLGDWLGLMAMLLQARYVLLDAEGRWLSSVPTAPPAQSHSEEASSGTSCQLRASGMGTGPAAGQAMALHPPHSAPGSSPHVGSWTRSSGSTSLVSSPGGVSGGSSTPGGSGGLSGSGGSGSAAVSSSRPPVSAGSSGAAETGSGASAWGPIRRLTEAEKKALRRKLEKLRKQRQSQANNP